MARSSPRVLDAVPDFLRYWRKARALSIDQQIDRWEKEAMARWPHLLHKLQENYTDDGFDWREVARRHVFPKLRGNMPQILRIRRALLKEVPRAWARTRRALGIDFDVTFLLYVGIGVGAGWATHYEGRPAVLFGLENAAEMHVERSSEATRGISHELAHVVHDHWRRRAGLGGLKDSLGGPYFKLYEEGFATECERRIESPRSFALRTGGEDWETWCRSHRAWLARRFLRDVKAHRSVLPFFGSWFNVRGHVETGYYLGAEMIRDWSRGSDLRELALLPVDTLRRRGRATLLAFSRGPA